ncbi:MAG: DNA repair protein RecN [Bacilli bacterium]|jgi:DNA repair protein RecN (Recombination protein N)|nr:DNA repair protein RecN [Bacilli bacterium]MCH4211083.1 DNA repair protein RecN [Bacilli bacterium]MCH4277680.1 DNA repair protein RecN [Bacilli bacterium]MCI2055343.1 DNA repair protein RecN [Bacilli bacterium]
MLKRLTITNLAIIENIDVTFKDGFTVLTGETGAGKSLVIDSLSLLLGARASNELIRSGEDSALIRGVFEFNSPQLEAILFNLSIPTANNEILIERTISKTRNLIKVNGTSVSLNDLNKISKYLADIHSQFDFEKILNPENYLGIIDGFSYEMTSSYKKEYQERLQAYKEKKQAYEAMLERKKKLEESKDFYEFQYKELKAADLKEGEEESLASELSLLRNYDKIYELSQEANELVHEDFLDKIYELDKTLEKLSEYQSQYKESHDRLDDSYYVITDIFDTLKKNLDSIDYDPDRLNELEQRDSDLNELKRKYKKSLPELIIYRDELEETMGGDSTFDEDLQKKKDEMDEALKSTIEKGKELTVLRKNIAKSIEKELERNMAELLLKAKFKVSFNELKEQPDESTLREDGLDEVDFLIETNVGEGLRSLSKVISGGEASRIMLAFKSVFIKANKIATVIFDEIDTGISGETAQAVAKKIHEISLSSQVIAITHMPQVASLSDHHILISKEVKGNRTYAHMKELNLDEKIRQIAYLISGGKITDKQLEYAKEMVLDRKN